MHLVKPAINPFWVSDAKTKLNLNRPHQLNTPCFALQGYSTAFAQDAKVAKGFLFWPMGTNHRLNQHDLRSGVFWFLVSGPCSLV